MSNIKDEHFFGRDHGEHEISNMNFSLDGIMVNISGLVQSPPTVLPGPTTNQQVQRQRQPTNRWRTNLR